MRRLVCTSVVRKPWRQLFSHRGPCYAQSNLVNSKLLGPDYFTFQVKRNLISAMKNLYIPTGNAKYTLPWIETRIVRESDYSPAVALFLLLKTPIKGHNSVTNLWKMTGNNPILDLANMNAYIKFGEIPSICSKILSKISDSVQGP